MTINKLLSFFLITILSLSINLLIPLVIYLKKVKSEKDSKNPIGFNIYSVLMDGLLAALMNITVLNFLLEKKPPILQEDLVKALLLGTLSMLLAHILMAIRKWKFWIMPKPWHWNLGGYWHMISMTLQMSFFFYPLVILLKNPSLWQEKLTQISLAFFSFWSLLFIMAFYWGNKSFLKIEK